MANCNPMTCRRCKRTLDETMFIYPKRYRMAASRRSRTCLDCRADDNPQATRKAQRVAHMYKITLPEAVALLQTKACAICASPHKLCVDHCHTTGKVRGMLCMHCNWKLAALEHDEWRKRAYAYLGKTE